MGYQDINNGKNTGKVLMGATFQTVSGEKVTLGDIKPNDNFDQEGGSSIIFINNMGGAKEYYVYFNQDWADTIADAAGGAYDGLKAGWYIEDAFIAVQEWVTDPEGPAPALVNQNNVQFEVGEAIMMSPAAYGGFISSGEVAEEDTEVVGDGNGKIVRCNCSPVSITLGDILPNELFDQEGGSSIIFLNELGGAKEYYVYFSQDWADTIADAAGGAYDGLKAGWYIEDAFNAVQEWVADPEGPAPALDCQNNVPLAPGAGFLLSPTKDGGLIIPSAL